MEDTPQGTWPQEPDKIVCVSDTEIGRELGPIRRSPIQRPSAPTGMKITAADTSSCHVSLANSTEVLQTRAGSIVGLSCCYCCASLARSRRRRRLGPDAFHTAVVVGGGGDHHHSRRPGPNLVLKVPVDVVPVFESHHANHHDDTRVHVLVQLGFLVDVEQEPCRDILLHLLLLLLG